MCKSIVKGLSSVPNLKSLKIWGLLDNNYEAADDYFRDAVNMGLFPKLEHLESFDWQVVMHFGRCGWVDQLSNFYGG